MTIDEIKENIRNGYYNEKPEYIDVDFDSIDDGVKELLEDVGKAYQQVEDTEIELSKNIEIIDEHIEAIDIPDSVAIAHRDIYLLSKKLQKISADLSYIYDELENLTP